VADSWLVSNGSTRVIDRHFARFSGSVTKIQQQDLSGFFDAVRVRNSGGRRMVSKDRIPQGAKPPVNSYFSDSARHQFRTLTCSLWSLDEPDPRVDPHVKGPDLSVCQSLEES